MGDEQILTLTHATERDIDLLLVEELKCNAAFAAWLVALIENRTPTPGANLTGDVLHSVRRLQNRREIDIRFSVPGAKGPRLYLIENKLDTSDQPEQGESYEAERLDLVREGRAEKVFTALLCPEAYVATHAGFAGHFQAVVAYETIRDWLGAEAKRQKVPELGRRLQHRTDLMDQAITKARRGYEALIRPEVAHYNRAYVDVLKQQFPNLKPGPAMIKKGNPSESVTMIFGPATLPDWPFLPQTRLVHQLREGNANVNFYRWGDFFADIVAEFSAELKGTPYRLVPTSNKRKSGHSGLLLYVETPKVDNKRSFEEQREASLVGMKAADDLRLWVTGHRDLLERCAHRIDSLSSS